MDYPFVAIPNADIPAASNPLWQHVIDTYVGETNKAARFGGSWRRSISRSGLIRVRAA